MIKQKTYISFLRGINVSGQKKIKMEELRKLYSSAGLLNVKSYIQSGNLIFQSSIKSKKALSKLIARKIKTFLGYDVDVIMRTKEELEKIIKNNPHPTEPANRLLISFLSEKPKEIPQERIDEKKEKDDKIHFSDQEIYFYCPGGYGKSKLSNNFFEKELNLSATTRNWRSTNKILEIAKEISQE